MRLKNRLTEAVKWAWPRTKHLLRRNGWLRRSVRYTRWAGLLGLVIAGFWTRNYFENKAAGLQKLALPNSGYAIPPAGDPIVRAKEYDIDVSGCRLELRSINISDVFDAEFRKNNPKISWWMDSLGSYALNYQHSFLVMRYDCKPLNDAAPRAFYYEMLNPISDNSPDGADTLHFIGSLLASSVNIDYTAYDFGSIRVAKKQLTPGPTAGYFQNGTWVPYQMQDWMHKSHCIVLAQGRDALVKWISMEKTAGVITAQQIPYQVGLQDCNTAVNAMLLSADIEPIKTPGKLVTGHSRKVFDQISRSQQVARSN